VRRIYQFLSELKVASGRIGGAYYDPVTSKVYVLEDSPESPRYDITKMCEYRISSCIVYQLISLKWLSRLPQTYFSSVQRPKTAVLTFCAVIVELTAITSISMRIYSASSPLQWIPPLAYFKSALLKTSYPTKVAIGYSHYDY
jgi:hypothetical protein